MIVENTVRLMKNSGYMLIATNDRTVNIMYKNNIGGTDIVAVIDWRHRGDFTQEDGYTINRYLNSKIAEMGFASGKCLKLIFTEEPQKFRDLLNWEYGCWLVDTTSMNLLIYDNQPLAFDNLEMIVNAALDGLRNNDERGIKPAKKIPVITWILILMNTIAFFAISSNGDLTDLVYMVDQGALFGPYVIKYGQYERLLTSMFMHFGIDHLFNNMLVLFFMGAVLERTIGKIKYIIIYMGSGILGGVFSMYMYLHIGKNVVSAGASGAVFGVIGALMYIIIRNKGRLEDINLYQLIMFALLSLFHGITSSGIDNYAHIGGIISGVLLALILYRRKRGKEA